MILVLAVYETFLFASLKIDFHVHDFSQQHKVGKRCAENLEEKMESYYLRILGAASSSHLQMNSKKCDKI